MKSILKFIFSALIIFSLTSCEDNFTKNIKIEQDFEINDSVNLLINGEEIASESMQDASIYVKTAENNSMFVTLKNIILGHPEVEILCSAHTTKSPEAELYFSGMADYASIMNIKLNGIVSTKKIISLNIDTEYTTDIIGTWKPEKFEISFDNKIIPSDFSNIIFKKLHEILAQQSQNCLINMTLTENGNILTFGRDNKENYLLKYYIDNKDNFYIHLNSEFLNTIVESIDSCQNKNLLDSLNIKEFIQKLSNITIPVKYKLLGEDNSKLTIFINEETIKPFIEAMKGNIKELADTISQMTFLDFQKAFPTLGTFVSPELFEVNKKYWLDIIYLTLDYKFTFSIGTIFKRVS